MPSLPLFLAFFVTTVLFACIPGPAMLYAVGRTLAGGRRAGLMASLGIHLGGYAHVMAAAAGLSILLKTVPVLYAAIRLAGALYLAWLGLSLFRAKSAAEVDFVEQRPSTARNTFLTSITVEVLNPKTAMFFLAFLPQFTDAPAGTGLVVQFVVLGTIVNVLFSAADLVCVMLAAAVLATLRRSGPAQRVMQRAGGTILMALGAHLALQRS